MIVVRVQFPINVSNKSELVSQMETTTSKYEGLAGLTRKYYVMDEDGNHAGGIYLWKSKLQAETWYNEDWVKYMTQTWGEPPLLEYLDCPIVVDNEFAKVSTKDAA